MGEYSPTGHRTNGRSSNNLQINHSHVLVIGGGGYIGSALLPKLLAKGYKVRVLDLFVFGMEPITHVVDDPNIEIIRADFRDVPKVSQAMRDIDAVIHLGGFVGDPACAIDEDLTNDINLHSTRMLAELAKYNNIQRFIFASTCSVYGAGDQILHETSELNPVSLYARTKIQSEHILREEANENFAPVFLRFGTIYGLSGRTRFDLVINLLTAKALIEGEITVFGGDQWRPFVHVDDAALAVATALEAPLSAVREEVFNVGQSDQNFTIQEIGDIIQKMVPNAKLLNMGEDTDKRNYRVNFDKIKRVLNYEPQWVVEQGVQQVMDAIRNGKVQNYQDAKYSNVKFLREGGLPRFKSFRLTVNGLSNGHSQASDQINDQTTDQIDNQVNGHGNGHLSNRVVSHSNGYTNGFKTEATRQRVHEPAS